VTDPRLTFNEPMGPHTTYRVGGTVAVFATVRSLDDLVDLAPVLRERPVVVIGHGSNALFSDGHHDLTVVHLTGDFENLTWRDENGAVVVEAGAGLALPVAARRLAAQGVTGFSWAVGVPGTIGGAIAMNAGGHGSDMAASVTHVRVWRDGEVVTLEAEALAFGYRQATLQAGDVVISATLRLAPGDAATEQELLREIVRWRRAHQPGGANAGSVFRNPEGDHAGRLLEAAGCKGLRIGTAEISPKHANFIIADEGGAANDVLALMAEARTRVATQFGTILHPETRLYRTPEAS